MAETLEALYSEMVGCSSCKMRAGCTQVVLGAGQLNKPLLLIVGEAPGQQDDEEGEPFTGAVGEILRVALRKTGIIKRTNSLITNVLKCRPPKNKFPKGEPAEICVTKWLWEEIKLAAPQRMLLLGGTALKYVAALDGITACRGQWYNIRGVRTMATFHPSFILRQNNTGLMSYGATFEDDIKQVALEMQTIVDKAAAAVETKNSEGKPADAV